MLVEDETCCTSVGWLPVSEGQLTATSVMLALPTVPVPLETVQVCPVGWEKTVTE